MSTMFFLNTDNMKDQVDLRRKIRRFIHRRADMSICDTAAKGFPSRCTCGEIEFKWVD